MRVNIMVMTSDCFDIVAIRIVQILLGFRSQRPNLLGMHRQKIFTPHLWATILKSMAARIKMFLCFVKNVSGVRGPDTLIKQDLLFLLKHLFF